MAEPFLTDLTDLVKEWTHADSHVGALECRHFFSGAAAYRDGAIVATLTPVGLAFKVPDEIHDELIADGRAVALRYFPASPIKRNYVLFPEHKSVNATDAASLILGDRIDLS